MVSTVPNNLKPGLKSPIHVIASKTLVQLFIQGVHNIFLRFKKIITF